MLTLRSRPLRPLCIPTAALRPKRPQPLRTYADQASQPRTTPNPPLRNNLPLIAVFTVFACVPFYYFFHSEKAPNSEKQAIAKARAEARKEGGGPGTEYRDVRDSPVKTLEDKRRKEEAGGR